MSIDHDIRVTAFNWLSEQIEIKGDVLPRSLLAKGFPYQGDRIPLVSPQGIFKPRQLDIPLTITTTPDSPYKDSFTEDDFLLYKYRGTDPMHRDNVGLRKAMNQQIPLIYFHGIVKGRYLVVHPVFIIGDDPDNLTFKVAQDRMEAIGKTADMVSEGDKARRAYITSTVKNRLHQQGFREKVIAAYQSQCAFCRLKHQELLDAAHIIPDKEEDGVPSVTNGLALCKIHHAAFDQYLIGVNTDYEIEVREDVLEEEDGPMLQHGLQGLHKCKLYLPKNNKEWPNQENLKWRYDKFNKAI